METNDRIESVELGRTSQRVSRLALGCMLMGTLTDEESSYRMLDSYTDAGGDFLDTANCYAWWNRRGSEGGESEELLGRWFERTGRRDDVFLATKGSAVISDLTGVWPDGDGEPDWDLARSRFEGAGGQTLRRAVDDSLRRLRTDHIDLYYVHVDDLATPLEETLSALTDIVLAGKVRYIGWSNVRTWRLERIRQLAERNGWVSPVALQQQHTYLRRRAGLNHASIVDDEQWDYLRANPEVSLVAYSPILKGIYDSAAKRDGHWMMTAYQGPDADARLAELVAVASEVGATPNQVVLAWHLRQQSPVVLPLIGPRTVEQYENTVAALDVKLTDEHLARLDAAGA
jgi:aryl-alcohol dehydrogenase-like predicted oxidoreductase